MPINLQKDARGYKLLFYKVRGDGHCIHLKSRAGARAGLGCTCIARWCAAAVRPCTKRALPGFTYASTIRLFLTRFGTDIEGALITLLHRLIWLKWLRLRRRQRVRRAGHEEGCPGAAHKHLFPLPLRRRTMMAEPARCNCAWNGRLV